MGVAYIPTIQWRGPIDYIAVWSYILAVIPSILLLAQEFGFMDKTASNEKKTMHHVVLMILFVVFTHFAMVFGMADPQLAGYMPPNQPMQMNHSMMDHSNMDHSNMNHQQMNIK